MLRTKLTFTNLFAQFILKIFLFQEKKLKKNINDLFLPNQMLSRMRMSLPQHHLHLTSKLQIMAVM